MACEALLTSDDNISTFFCDDCARQRERERRARERAAEAVDVSDYPMF